MKIEPHKTAIHRSKPSHSVKDVEQRGLIKNPVFDYGCGTGTDAQFLISKGYTVNFWDPYFHNEKPPSEYPSCSFNTIFCTYILNVIQRNERIDVIEKTRKLLSKNGQIFFTVRTHSDIESQAKKNDWKKEADGWITKRGTFQKGFSSKELEELLQKEGFKTRIFSKNPLIVEAKNS